MPVRLDGHHVARDGRRAVKHLLPALRIDELRAAVRVVDRGHGAGRVPGIRERHLQRALVERRERHVVLVLTLDRPVLGREEPRRELAVLHERRLRHAQATLAGARAPQALPGPDRATAGAAAHCGVGQVLNVRAVKRERQSGWFLVDACPMCSAPSRNVLCSPPDRR